MIPASVAICRARVLDRGGREGDARQQVSLLGGEARGGKGPYTYSRERIQPASPDLRVAGTTSRNPVFTAPGLGSWCYTCGDLDNDVPCARLEMIPRNPTPPYPSNPTT